MRTKNAKRLWPVPATFAVMAVAAFLAFGLMATNGAQPAAAQDADRTVTINNGGGGGAVTVISAVPTMLTPIAAWHNNRSRCPRSRATPRP